MSLNSIEAYVNEIISSNRESHPEHITTYFKLMGERAAEMLDQLQAASRLLGLEALPADVIHLEQKKVLLEAVNYILTHSIDLGHGLKVIKDSGLLDLENNPPPSRYHMLYQVEPLLKYASELYSQNLNWWNAWKLRNQSPRYFVNKFEDATPEEPKQEVAEVKVA